MFPKYLVMGSVAHEILQEPLRFGDGYKIERWEKVDCELTTDWLTPIFDHKKLSKKTRSVWGFVYIVRLLEGEWAGAYKIGYTHMNVYQRTASTAYQYKCTTERVWAIKSYGYAVSSILEGSLHFEFREKRIKRELFRLTQDDIELIKSIPGGVDISLKQNRPHGLSWKQVAGLDSKQELTA